LQQGRSESEEFVFSLKNPHNLPATEFALKAEIKNHTVDFSPRFVQVFVAAATATSVSPVTVTQTPKVTLMALSVRTPTMPGWRENFPRRFGEFHLQRNDRFVERFAALTF
jgi:hypothetical protein